MVEAIGGKSAAGQSANAPPPQPSPQPSVSTAATPSAATSSHASTVSAAPTGMVRRAAHGIGSRDYVNPNFKSGFFDLYKPVVRHDTPLPRTFDEIEHARSQPSKGQLRTSLFGLTPCTYNDITVDEETGRVVDKDESLPLIGGWQQHRRVFNTYNLYQNPPPPSSSSQPTTTPITAK